MKFNRIPSRISEVKYADGQTDDVYSVHCVQRVHKRIQMYGLWESPHPGPDFVAHGAPYVSHGGVGGSLQCSCPIKVKLQASATYLWDSCASTRHVTRSSASHWLMFGSRVYLRHWSTLRVAPKGRIIQRGETIMWLNMFIACYREGWSVSKSTGCIVMMYTLLKGVVASDKLRS